jgi:O-acetyl-ADP-ribose deacetylase (regulator of RNase III)
MTGESVDMYAALARSDSGRRILAMLEEEARKRDGTARLCQWQAEDGWLIIYTTSRVEGGPHHGKWVTQALRPYGKGARTGKATQLREAYRREFSTRKAARARAIALYAQHSPKWKARAGR